MVVSPDNDYTGPLQQLDASIKHTPSFLIMLRPGLATDLVVVTAVI